MTRESERELARAVDKLDADSDLSVAGLITVCSTAYGEGPVELVDRSRRLVRVDGELHRATVPVLEKLDWAPRTGDCAGDTCAGDRRPEGAEDVVLGGSTPENGPLTHQERRYGCSRWSGPQFSDMNITRMCRVP